MLKIVGAILVLAGIAGLAFGVLHGGFNWSRQDKVVETGANQGAVVKTHSLPLAPIAGGFCIIAGVVVLMASGRNSQ